MVSGVKVGECPPLSIKCNCYFLYSVATGLQRPSADIRSRSDSLKSS